MENKREYGQSLVLVALLMIGMLAFLGLILDGGYAYVTRRWGQDAADAAALAGTRELALQKTETVISSTISTFALANRTAGIADVTAYYIDKDGNNLNRIPNGSVPTLATGVRVTTTLRFQPFFISLLIGRNPIPIPSVAAAQSGVASAGAMVAPMSVPFPCSPYNQATYSSCSYFTPGTDFALQGDKQGPGGFQWVSYECDSTANSIVGYLTLSKTSGLIMADKSDTYYNPLNPTQFNTPPPNPNPWICSGPGVQPNNNIRDALDCWLEPTKAGCWTSTSYPGDRKWVVPIYDVNNGQSGSNFKYHVVLLGEFEFNGYWFANNQCNWYGKPAGARCNRRNDLPSSLQACFDSGDKCIMGKFLKEVENLRVIPGKCNTNGLDVCGVGLSQ